MGPPRSGHGSGPGYPPSPRSGHGSGPGYPPEVVMEVDQGTPPEVIMEVDQGTPPQKWSWKWYPPMEVDMEVDQGIPLPPWTDHTSAICHPLYINWQAGGFPLKKGFLLVIPKILSRIFKTGIIMNWTFKQLNSFRTNLLGENVLMDD